MREGIEAEGVIKETLPSGFFRVELNNEHSVMARLAGKMSKRHIRVMIGDRVRVELSPYDLTRGRITWRYRDAPAPTPGARS